MRIGLPILTAGDRLGRARDERRRRPEVAHALPEVDPVRDAIDDLGERAERVVALEVLAAASEGFEAERRRHGAPQMMGL